MERSKSIASTQAAEGIISVVHGMIGRKNREEVVAKGIIPMLFILGKMDNYIDYDLASKNINCGSFGRIITLHDVRCWTGL